MRASAILVAPPFLKIANGPLLGTAMLVGAGRLAGHDVRLLDLNAEWIREHLPVGVALELQRFVGDHDRPAALTEMHRDFLRELDLHEPNETHDAVLNAGHRLARSAFGQWVNTRMANRMNPEIVGLSVMYRDQVEPALAISIIARALWPNALIVWGGAHVTALRDEIANERAYGCDGLIDRFVVGYAERTWVDLLDTVTTGTDAPEEVMQAGGGRWLRALEERSVVPVFDDVDDYHRRGLTIPLQSSRGCGYAACAHCTYPSIEGPARDLPWDAFDRVLALALNHGARLSLKDSLLDGERLEEVASRVAGRVKWSACTKLDAKLPRRLARLGAAGCATLEIGLETLDVEAQKTILKRQRETVFYELLDAAAAHVSLIVNYMTGLPGADPDREATCMARVVAELEKRKPQLVAALEHNRFQLERLSPMGLDPSRYGIRVTRRLPWTTVMEWIAQPQLVKFHRFPIETRRG